MLSGVTRVVTAAKVGKCYKQPSELFDASPNQPGTLDRMSAEHLAPYRRLPRPSPATLFHDQSTVHLDMVGHWA
jgi:hypothetical protein